MFEIGDSNGGQNSTNANK